MRVFVTGASGFIGSETVRDLIEAGHDVLGMARSPEAADRLKAAGADVHQGDLRDPATLVSGLRDCDGVIHLGFIHDFSKWDESMRIDLVAIEAMLGALAGTGKRFISTSGTAVVPPGIEATEASPPGEGEHRNKRGDSETVVLAAADRGIRTMVMRLPPTTHGRGDHGFVPMLIDVARRTGVSAYVGTGENRWPATHRTDAARCYRLAFEKGEAGSRFHATAEAGVPMRLIAEAIGEGLGIPIRSLEPAEAASHFGWLSHFAGRDNPASSAVTRATLGWEPTGPDLVTDLRENGYFG